MKNKSVNAPPVRVQRMVRPIGTHRIVVKPGQRLIVFYDPKKEDRDSLYKSMSAAHRRVAALVPRPKGQLTPAVLRRLRERLQSDLTPPL